MVCQSFGMKTMLARKRAERKNSILRLFVIGTIYFTHLALSLHSTTKLDNVDTMCTLHKFPPEVRLMIYDARIFLRKAADSTLPPLLLALGPDRALYEEARKEFEVRNSNLNLSPDRPNARQTSWSEVDWARIKYLRLTGTACENHTEFMSEIERIGTGLRTRYVRFCPCFHDHSRARLLSQTEDIVGIAHTNLSNSPLFHAVSAVLLNPMKPFTSAFCWQTS